MLRRLFARWFSRRSPQAPAVRRAPASPAHRNPPLAVPAAVAIPEPDAPHVAGAELGAGPHAGEAPGAVAREGASGADLEQEFLCMLRERCRVLLFAAPPETHETDAPAVVESLIRLGETVIRQPPVAAQRLLAAVRDPNRPLHEFIPLFESDPALTRGLLRMANSAYYRRGSDPCISIAESVQLIGLRGVECVVTQSMVEGMLCRPGGLYMHMVTDAWAHMTRTAPLARRLSAAFVVQPEAAFVMGLLHDVGQLVVFDHLSSLRTQYQREPFVPPAFLEALLGRLHEPLGGIAAVRWGLGNDVALAIAGHHREPPPERPLLLTELLYVAEQVDHAEHAGERLSLDRIWQNGELTANIEDVRVLLGLPDPRLARNDDARRAAA